MNKCKKIDITLENDILYIDFLNSELYSDDNMDILLTLEYKNKTIKDLEQAQKNIIKRFGKKIIMDR